MSACRQGILAAISLGCLFAAPPDWVPMRWNLSAAKHLELLHGTPVNCILVDPRLWEGPLLQQARRRALAIVGVLRPADAVSEKVSRAVELRLDGVVLEGDFDSAAIADARRVLAGAGMPLIELPSRKRIRFGAADVVMGTSQGLWPGVHVDHGGKVFAGPTSSPWIDTNSGFLQFARAAANTTLWIGVTPPHGMVCTAEQYLQAIGDAVLGGARWIVALDADLERRLETSDARAAAVWNRIAAGLRYFEDHQEWHDYRPYSTLALLQDTATGGLLSGGLLDMLSSQHTAVRALPTRALNDDALRGTQVLLEIERQLTEEQKEALEKFRKSGGVLLAPPPGAGFPSVSEDQITMTAAQMRRLEGIWELVYNTTLRKNFGVREFNVSGVLSRALARPDGQSIIVHLVNYTDYPRDEATALQVLGQWRRARLYSPDAPVQELPVYGVESGTGVDVERLTTFATLRVDK